LGERAAWFMSLNESIIVGTPLAQTARQALSWQPIAVIS
jgi:hypothetical protein